MYVRRELPAGHRERNPPQSMGAVLPSGQYDPAGHSVRVSALSQKYPPEIMMMTPPAAAKGERR